MASPEAATSVPPAAGPSDPTFRGYTAKQAASYVAGRPGYPDALIQTILTHHTATGGQLTTLLDVGLRPRQGNTLIRAALHAGLRRRPVC